MDNVLNEQITGQIKTAFAELKEPAQILFFASKENCEYCGEVQQLLEEVAAVDEKLGFSYYDIKENKDIAAQYHVDKTPAIVIAAKDGDKFIDLGVQYFGVPSGYEFSVLINAIILVSKRDSGLSQNVRAFLKNLQQPLHLQVFVTPT